MDIKDLQPQKDRVIDILHPGTGEKLNIEVSVLSINDPEMTRIKRKLTDERLQLEKKGKTYKATDLEENRNVITLSAMTGWKWNKDSKFKGEKPEFNRKNVMAVFGELSWFRDQIEEAVSDDTAFFTT